MVVVAQVVEHSVVIREVGVQVSSMTPIQAQACCPYRPKIRKEWSLRVTAANPHGEVQ